MWAIIKRLIWEENYAIQVVRGAVGLLGMLFITGAVTLDSLGDQFGRFGWWLGIVMTACAWWIRAGDNTLKTLQQTPDADLHAAGVATLPPPGTESKGPQ